MWTARWITLPPSGRWPTTAPGPTTVCWPLVPACRPTRVRRPANGPLPRPARHAEPHPGRRPLLRGRDGKRPPGPGRLRRSGAVPHRRRAPGGAGGGGPAPARRGAWPGRGGAGARRVRAPRHPGPARADGPAVPAPKPPPWTGARDAERHAGAAAAARRVLLGRGGPAAGRGARGARAHRDRDEDLGRAGDGSLTVHRTDPAPVRLSTPGGSPC